MIRLAIAVLLTAAAALAAHHLRDTGTDRSEAPPEARTVDLSATEAFVRPTPEPAGGLAVAEAEAVGSPAEAAADAMPEAGGLEDEGPEPEEPEDGSARARVEEEDASAAPPFGVAARASGDRGSTARDATRDASADARAGDAAAAGDRAAGKRVAETGASAGSAGETFAAGDGFADAMDDETRVALIRRLLAVYGRIGPPE